LPGETTKLNLPAQVVGIFTINQEAMSAEVATLNIASAVLQLVKINNLSH
jgi:hypothetical protein